MAREHHHGRALRSSEVVCGRVHVTVVRDDERLGLAPRERAYLMARFVDELQPGLRDELRKLARRRGAAARRIAETLEPVDLVLCDPEGTERRIRARIQPPVHGPHGELRAIEFGLRGPSP